MFAWKSMDGTQMRLGNVSSSLVKLKLDMVYRDLSMETASVQFTEITRPAPPVIEKPKPKKKVIKVAVPEGPTGPKPSRSNARQQVKPNLSVSK